MLDQRRVVTTTPENSETPLENVRSWVTPTRLFFVRNHFPTPSVDLNTWRLRVSGAVEHELEEELGVWAKGIADYHARRSSLG